MRSANVERKTAETSVAIELNLDGSGVADIKTGIGFFDHMLILLTKHGQFDLKVDCQGDLMVDGHHSVEDIGITLGMAFAKALADKKGIKLATSEIQDYQLVKAKEYDRLADTLRQSLDMEYIYEIMGVASE